MKRGRRLIIIFILKNDFQFKVISTITNCNPQINVIYDDIIEIKMKIKIKKKKEIEFYFKTFLFSIMIRYCLYCKFFKYFFTVKILLGGNFSTILIR